MQQELEKLINELVKLGEDREELAFWQTIYPDMTANEQQKLLKILAEEIISLQKADH